MLSFLQLLLSKKVGYSSVCTARAAVLLLDQSEDNFLSKNGLLTRFMKGVSKISPPKPKYSSTWDPMPVLVYLRNLEPIDGLTLEKLTLKLVGILALATGQRIQTLQSIQLTDLVETDNAIQINISKMLKTSKPGKTQPCLYLPRFETHKEWCAVRTLKMYLAKTDPIRNGRNQLFLGLNKNHVEVSTQTISRWIKTVLKDSGIDVSSFTSYSTRHASTSSAYRAGVPLDQIRERAGWSTSSEMFARFYNRPIDKRAQFSRSVFTNN